MSQKRNLTPKKDIVEYWEEKLRSSESNVTYEMALTHCWRCRVKKRLDRCHIVARSLGGEDMPSNYVLLCKHCHFESPNIVDPEYIWDWLVSHKMPDKAEFWFYKGMLEYERIYRKDFSQEILGNEDLFFELFEKEKASVAHHFGQPRFNASTTASLIARTLKLIEEA